MARTREAAGGGRVVEVPPERLAGWFDRFAERNDGVLTTHLEPRGVTVRGGNGTVATAMVPFEPLEDTDPSERQGLAVGPLLAHVARSRRIGLLLVRLGGHSVGVAEGGVVVRSRTDRHQVHGRSAAGGWSQQRFARRRAGQARHSLQAAASDAADVLGGELSTLDSVVLGGDRRALEELRADRRLAPVFALAGERVLDLAEPRRSVLDEAAQRALAVEIHIREPESPR